MLLLLLPAVDCVLHIASSGVGGLQHRASFEHCCSLLQLPGLCYVMLPTLSFCTTISLPSCCCCLPV
jgi:hypothetical protein